MIVRELTARGAGGVAVVELRGTGALELASRLSAAPLPKRAGAAVLRRLQLDGESIDEALVWIESEERVELHVHASPPLVRALLTSLIGLGVRPAQDLAGSIEHRATHLLASAVGDSAARILLDQAEGALRREIESVLALEDVVVVVRRLDALRAAGRLAQFALTPTRVAIVGVVNSGKSTLFNALVGVDRAIVSAHAGATRDALVERAQFGEWPVELIDTAGERELDGASPEVALERAGQRRASELRGTADWTIRLSPPPYSPSVEPAHGAEARIASRADLVAVPPVSFDAVISTRRDPKAAVQAVHELFRAAFELPRSAWTPGAAVPFDAPSREGVRAALGAAQRSVDDWRSPLVELLERAD